MSTLVGAPAGSAVIRNGMCWHGAVSDTTISVLLLLAACPERTRDDLTSVLLAQTPNLSDEVRILPSIEYGGFPGTPKTMPYEQWEKLSVRSQIRFLPPNPPPTHPVSSLSVGRTTPSTSAATSSANRGSGPPVLG